MTSTLAPPDANPLKKNDFIRQIIREDLAAGRHATVRTRFPPEPNGYLHLGHAKAIYLNFGIGQEFGGPVNLRFDDTNPAKEDPEYVEAIKEDVRWLGFEWAELRHASDYFEVFYRSALKLIRDGKAYVCDLDAEQVREYRGTLKPASRSGWCSSGWPTRSTWSTHQSYSGRWSSNSSVHSECVMPSSASLRQCA